MLIFGLNLAVQSEDEITPLRVPIAARRVYEILARGGSIQKCYRLLQDLADQPISKSTIDSYFKYMAKSGILVKADSKPKKDRAKDRR